MELDKEFKITGKPTDGPISRYVNRRISTRITRFIIKHNIPLTPNQISVISFIMALAVLPLYLYGYSIPAGILVQLSSIIDGVDGELARALNMISKKGGFIDTILDRYSDIIILLSLILYLSSTRYLAIHILIFAVLCISGTLMVSYIHTRGQYDFEIHPAYIGYLDSIASRDVRLFIIFIGSVIGLIEYTIIILAIITHIYVIVKTINMIAMKHEEIQ
ncbi:MAG: CDP-alcohol phosphatidyltransferase family protein [Thermoprotei archaeon]|nr:MAG: CDP-alcohol phosphatidyltransferase family protein [Thermoprotei archaeon]